MPSGRHLDAVLDRLRPVPGSEGSPAGSRGAELTPEERQRLRSLGYVK